MGKIFERYTPVPVAANATIEINNSSVGGFLCTVSGSLTLTTKPADGKLAVAIVSALPVTAGFYYPMPFFLGINGGTLVASGGAAGTLGV